MERQCLADAQAAAVEYRDQGGISRARGRPSRALVDQRPDFGRRENVEGAFSGIFQEYIPSGKEIKNQCGSG